MTEETNNITWDIPNILVNTELQNGLRVQTVREGGPASFVSRTTREEVEEAVNEVTFAVRATNRINFGGGYLNVINDESAELSPTSPTAAEYLAKIGEEVMIAFSCRPTQAPRLTDQGKHFIVGRTYITLR